MRSRNEIVAEAEIIIEKDKCEICGYSKHKGSLHIHHVDGNHANNNKFNLQIICANCHFEIHHTSKRKTVQLRWMNIRIDDDTYQKIKALQGQLKHGKHEYTISQVLDFLIDTKIKLNDN